MYKPELKQDMIKLISIFFQEEKGNRVTKFQIDGLLVNIQTVFEKHKVPDKKDGE